jgi:predicted membrane protein
MRAHTFAGLIIVLFGLSFLFRFPIFNVVVALLIIWVGVRVFTGKEKDFNFQTKGVISEDVFRKILIFSGIDAKLISKNFKDAEVVTIFGGGNIDMSEVKTKESGIDMDLVAIFGGIKIKIPKDWKIESEGVGMFGGFKDNTDAPSKPSVTVHLKGAAIFGGIEVAN